MRWRNSLRLKPDKLGLAECYGWHSLAIQADMTGSVLILPNVGEGKRGMTVTVAVHCQILIVTWVFPGIRRGLRFSAPLAAC